MPSIHSDYFSKLKFYIPELRSEKGACYGHSYMGMHALLASDRDTFARRLDAIAFGLPKPGNPEEKIRLKDFAELIKDLKLEQAAQHIISANHQIKLQFENAKQPEAHAPSGPTESQRFINLVKEIGREEFIPWLEEEEKSLPPPQPTTVTNYFSDEELANQIDLACCIREAFIHQTYDRIKLTLEADFKGSDKQEISNRIKAKVTAELEKFDRENPFIYDLVTLDIYFQNIALYQVPQGFNLIGSKHENFLSVQTMMQLIAPVNLNNKIENVAKFTRNFSLDKLQLYFDTLANALKSYYLTHYSSDDPKLKNDVPLSLNLLVDSHAISIGYNVSKAKWILIDSNKLPFKEVSEAEIAHVVRLALICRSPTTITSPYSAASICFDAANDQWILLNSHDNAPQNFLEGTYHKLIQSLIASPKLKHIETLNFNMLTEVYLNKAVKSELEPIVTSWLKSKAFQQICAITPENANAFDDLEHRSLLNFAVLINDVDTVKKLFQAGADINKLEGGRLGYLTLITAVNAAYFNPEMVQLLLEYANTNLEDIRGNTALTHAVAQADLSILNFLLNTNKFNVNNTTHLGVNALNLAVKQGRVDVVQMLLQHGAKTDFAECNRIEDSSLYVHCSDKKVAKLLEEYYLSAKKTLPRLNHFSTFFQNKSVNADESREKTNLSAQTNFSIK